MSAKVVGRGAAAGMEFWIEEEVVRVGSDPHCEISIPSSDLASHVVTVEYHQGRYLIHNRESGAILLGGQTVPERTSATWPAGADLQLSRSVVLQLVITGDPAPARQAAAPLSAELGSDEPWSGEDDDDADKPEIQKAPAGDPKRTKTIIQAAVTALCVAGSIFMLSSGGSQGGGAVDRRQAFDALFQSADQMDPEVRQLLQAAWAAEGMRSRQPEEARRQYEQLVELLHHRLQDSAAGEAKPAEKARQLDREILEFAEDGLAGSQ